MERIWNGSTDSRNASPAHIPGLQSFPPENLTPDEATVVLETMAAHLECRACHLPKSTTSGRLLYIANEWRKRARELAGTANSAA